jgi:trans-aconitate 2-methyltransferase
LSWSAKQYVAFEDERTRPVRDLLGALPDMDARTVIDLGCGPGNSTEVLALRFPRAQVSGIDSSADMIAAARLRLPRVSFALQEVQTWRAAGPYDVVLANAVLQWVPDHEIVLPSLMARLAPGGALAVQMPDNLDGPAHRLMREVAGAGPWAAKLVQARAARTAVADAEWYYQLLRPLCSRVDLWRTTYYHSLTGGAAAIVEWFKGSGLRPYLEPLSETERGAYLARYTAAISSAYPCLADGSVLLPFPRMFMVAIR